MRRSACSRQSETGYSTQKPVECMRRPIENNSAPGKAVYEPSGSGTTIIAAEMTGRVAHAIEIASDRPPITPLVSPAR
jgi:DNA modification methylase